MILRIQSYSLKNGFMTFDACAIILVISGFFCFLFFFVVFFFFLVFLGPSPWHMEGPRLGVKLEL